MAPPLLLISWLAACGTDPVQQDVTTYQAAMQPLLVENRQLAKGFEAMASEVKTNATDAPRIAEKLAKEISPSADDLKSRAEKIEPVTPQLGEAHALLVKAWTDRATAYHQMSDAWAANDPAGFESARQKNVQSKIDEEKFFQTVNQLAQPYGVEIDQYP